MDVMESASARVRAAELADQLRDERSAWSNILNEGEDTALWEAECVMRALAEGRCDYRFAKGALSGLTDEPAEVTIRRIRGG